jgi:hypothetical protein
MTFEEFFKKKRIDLTALQSGEPLLFSEFKMHFEQMGEKSFDHTKKYWFNKLRLRFHLAPELKPEKVHIENRLAEQTIAESILEEQMPAPSVGFKPRFKPGMAKPAVGSDIKNPLPKESSTATPEVNKAAAVEDQNPSFQQEKEAMQAKADEMPRTTDNAQGEPNAPVTKATGFKPRFNMKMTEGKSPQTKEFVPEDEQSKEAAEAEPIEHAAPKPAGFKPRFNAKMVKPKPGEEVEAKPEIEEQNEAEEQPATTSEALAPKPAGFKPRFNAKMVASKPKEGAIEKAGIVDEAPVEEAALPATTENKVNDNIEQPVQEADTSVEVPVSKPAGFKPRFNAKMVKPKPPEEDNNN